MTKELFIERMEGITLSSNVGETYFKVYGENWRNDDWYSYYTFQKIKDGFDKGYNLPFNIYQKVYSRVILMFLYLERNSEKLILGKPKEQYFQELEEGLHYESWRKMLKVVSKEKEIVRRIIGGCWKYWDPYLRPIYFINFVMTIHIMDFKGLESIVKRIVKDNPSVFCESGYSYNPSQNKLSLHCTSDFEKEREEYMIKSEGLEKISYGHYRKITN